MQAELTFWTAKKDVEAKESGSPRPAYYSRQDEQTPAPPEEPKEAEPEPADPVREEVKRVSVKSGPLTHIYSFNIRTRELSDFSSETRKATKQSYNFSEVYEDSAWCALPNNTLLICGGSLQANKSALCKAGEVNLDSMDYSPLPNMGSERSYHAVI